MSISGAPNRNVSVNICSEENLLSPTIFGLKYDEKVEYSLAKFSWYQKVMPVDFGDRKMSFWARKKAT